MNPKNINSYLTFLEDAVLYNRYYGELDHPGDDQRKHLDACRTFKQAVPRDEVTPDWVTRFYWPTHNSAYSALSDIDFLKMMLENDHMLPVKDTRHVLLTSFFEAEDFDYDNYVIRVPAERLVSKLKNVVFAEDVQFIFIESKQPGKMIPFIYDSSIESNAHLNTNDDMLKHRFKPGIQSIGWSLEIIHPKGWTWQDVQSTNKTAVNANKAAADNLAARSKKAIMDALAAAGVSSYGAPTGYKKYDSAKPYMDMNAINQIFNEIKNTGSYNNLDESDYNGMFNL